MAATVYGAKIPFGLATPMPLMGFPEGKEKIITRHNEFAVVEIFDGIKTKRFHPQVKDQNWIPFIEIENEQ